MAASPLDREVTGLMLTSSTSEDGDALVAAGCRWLEILEQNPGLPAPPRAEHLTAFLKVIDKSPALAPRAAAALDAYFARCPLPAAFDEEDEDRRSPTRGCWTRPGARQRAWACSGPCGTQRRAS